MELAVSILVIVTFGAYFFYLNNIAKKNSYSKPNQAASELRKTKIKPREVKPLIISVKPELNKPKAAVPKQFKCVIIKTGTRACQSAQHLALKPILMNEAPVLPLAGCDAVRCDCKFTKHDDRRSDDRRAHLKAAREIMGDALNRREKKERRGAQL